MTKRNLITKSLIATAIFMFFAVSVATAQDIYTTKKGYLASPTKAGLDKAMRYINAKDNEALRSMLDTHQAIAMKAGVKVYIEDTSWGKIKIRPVGVDGTIWTVMEAVK